MIPRKFEDSSFYCEIRAHLTRKTKDFNAETFTTQKYYEESEKYFIIPRFFPIHKYFECQLIDKSDKGEDIEIEHNIIPRNDIQKEAMKFMLENNKGIIQLKPGTGKTVISIYTIAERKKRTFILVHRDALVKQWKERILQFTNLNENKIGILSSVNFENELFKPICIGTNQTFISLLKRKNNDIISCISVANIGMFLADEVHTTVGAETFSKCSLNMPSRIVFGLSATPERSDGNTDIINYHLGDVFSIESSEGTMPARITVIGFDYGIDQPNRYKYLHWDGNFQRSRYLNIMKNSKFFMGVLKALILKVSNDDRRTLVICERVEKLIDILYKWYPGISKGRFVAGSSRDELESHTVFSTPTKIRDGVDANWLDCLIVTSPVSNMEQLSGRINRIRKNKKIPIILDMVDIGCTQIRNTLYRRMKFYRKSEWDVNFIFINREGKQVKVGEETFMKIMRGE